MDEKVKILLREIAESLHKRIREHAKEIEEITSHLEVNVEEYEELMVSEVMNDSDIYIGVQFAFPPYQNHTPEDLKKKALELLEKKIKRDHRLYLEA